MLILETKQSGAKLLPHSDLWGGEWISRRWDVGIWTGLGWPRIETGGGHV